MADMAGALMRGYGFVNSIQQQDRQNKRLDELYERQKLVDKRSDEEYEKKKSEESGLREGIFALIKSMAAKDPSWQQVAANPAATEKMVTLAEDPLAAAKAVNQWHQVKENLDSGKLPDGKLALDFLNNPNVAGRDLSRRFAANKLSGALSAVYPTPDKQGLFFEATLTGPDGKEYVAPLTKGKTVSGAPGSEQDPVESYPIDKLLSYGQGAAEGNLAALSLIAEKGGTAGAQFALQFIMEKDKAKRESLVKEYEHLRDRSEKEYDHLRDRSEKKSDEEAKQKFELKKLGIQEQGKHVEVIKDSDGNVTGVFDKRTMKFSPTEGLSASNKGYITTDSGQVFKKKDAEKMFKELPNIFLPKASSSDDLLSLLASSGDDLDSLPSEAKKSIVAAAEEVAADPKATAKERAMAKLWLNIGEEMGVFPKEPKQSMDTATAHTQVNDPGMGIDPKKFAEELARVKAARGNSGVPKVSSEVSTGTQAAPQQAGGVMRSLGRTLAGPGGPQSDSMGLRSVAQGLSAGAELATPAMVEGIKDLPNTVKQNLIRGMTTQRWTVKQLADAIREIKAGYQEGSQ